MSQITTYTCDWCGNPITKSDVGALRQELELPEVRIREPKQSRFICDVRMHTSHRVDLHKGCVTDMLRWELKQGEIV